MSSWIHSIRAIGDVVIMIAQSDENKITGVYIITDLKKTTINRWLKAKSKGQFFHKNVRYNSKVKIEELWEGIGMRDFITNCGKQEATITLS